MQLIHSGKVRDVYADTDSAHGEHLVLVASDRISVYDVILPTPVADKGRILTQLSLWWFEQLSEVVPNHILGEIDPAVDDVPADWAGRAVRCQKLTMAPIECVARGYLTGSGLIEYRRSGTVCGVSLPAGLVDGSKLPEAIFTPTTKAPVGTHDEPITFDEVVATLGGDVAERLRTTTLELYRRGAAVAAERGIIIADTKVELGFSSTGELTLGDELLTPDSSRFWPADQWQPGRAQAAFDKQYVRDWAAGTGWNKSAPGPGVPAEVVAATRARYVEAFERLTAQSWAW
jgi:phosphoribosylaminoimidazole-succinocarboxamide synthase